MPCWDHETFWKNFVHCEKARNCNSHLTISKYENPFLRGYFSLQNILLSCLFWQNFLKIMLFPISSCGTDLLTRLFIKSLKKVDNEFRHFWKKEFLPNIINTNCHLSLQIEPISNYKIQIFFWNIFFYLRKNAMKFSFIWESC